MFSLISSFISFLSFSSVFSFSSFSSVPSFCCLFFSRLLFTFSFLWLLLFNLFLLFPLFPLFFLFHLFPLFLLFLLFHLFPPFLLFLLFHLFPPFLLFLLFHLFPPFLAFIFSCLILTFSPKTSFEIIIKTLKIFLVFAPVDDFFWAKNNVVRFWLWAVLFVLLVFRTIIYLRCVALFHLCRCLSILCYTIRESIVTQVPNIAQWKSIAPTWVIGLIPSPNLKKEIIK